MQTAQCGPIQLWCVWHLVWISPWSAATSHIKENKPEKTKSINQANNYLSTGTARPCGAHLPEVVLHVERKQVGGGDSQAQPNITHLQAGGYGYRLLAGNAKKTGILPKTPVSKYFWMRSSRKAFTGISVSDPDLLIPLRIQHFKLNSDPNQDSRFWWPKIEKIYSWKKLILFWSKLQFNYPQVCIKTSKLTGQTFSPQKRTSSTSKHDIS